VRVLIEVMRVEFGGVATWAENLLRTWPSVFPDDELHVLSTPAQLAALPSGGYVPHAIATPRPANLTRPLVQSSALPRLARRLGVDAVLAAQPSTSLRHPGPPFVVMVHDLRHEVLPHQFSRARLALRRVNYSRSYRIADGFVAVSQRTADDLHRLHPQLTQPVRVVHHGADHVDRWPRGAGADRFAIAFGHHTNKNVDLAVEAWARMHAAGVAGLPPLRVLGLSGEGRAALTAQVVARGLTGVVVASPYLPDDEFVRTMADAALVVFPSDFEGFGLPVVEAMRLRIPVVVGPDPAVLEVAGDHAFVMSEWSAAALAEATGRALRVTPDELDAAARHVAGTTWAAAVTGTRDALAALV